MRDGGLVLAPELVKWNVDAISGGEEKLEILQRRMYFTELAREELPNHTATFGPFTLACNIQKSRDAGAAPVIYAPQGIADSAISQMSTFAVRGTYHTQAVLKQILALKDSSDPEKIKAHYGMHVAPGFTLNLRNTSPDGTIVSSADVPAISVQQVIQHVAFNNIPFEHSIAVLTFFLNMLYPVDNEHSDDQLGYYRQREWRFIGADLSVNHHQMARSLTAEEQENLTRIDNKFWSREEIFDGKRFRRAELALIYQPKPGWRLWDVVEGVLVPVEAFSRAQEILGDLVPIEGY
jgi:hypothetical protein